MARTQYPINREFFPYNKIIPPVNKTLIDLAQKHAKVPAFVRKDPDLTLRTFRIPGYKGDPIDLLLLVPNGIPAPAPCFYDIHGGGFIFDAGPSQYRHAMTYAKEAGCIVAFVRYHLAPQYPYPYPQEDAYAALTWLYENAVSQGIDPKRIGIGGDSAGGFLAVTSCLMARDRGFEHMPLFQLLIYPFLDDRKSSDSYLRYTDTPMWNASMTVKLSPIIQPAPKTIPLAYRSPVEAESLRGLPPAYIEVAEFDGLHDDGPLYRDLLQQEGIPVEFHETVGTMHGFDTKVNAPTTQLMLRVRIEYLKRMFASAPAE